MQRDRLAADIKASANTTPVGATDMPTSPIRLEEAVVTGTPVAVQEAQAANPEPAPAAENATTSPGNATTSAPAAPLTPQQQLAADIAKSGSQENLAPAQPLEGRTDPVVAATAEAYRNMDRSFADLLQSQKDEYERKRLEGEQEVRDEQKAAKWTGLTELAASLANMIGVGQGNAVSQTYRPHSQDWMQKADASIKEHRSRMENLRQRQRETEQKIAQLKSEGGLAVAQMQAKMRQQAIDNEIARQKLVLDERYKAGQMTLDQYKAETDRIRVAMQQAYNNARLGNESRRLGNESRRLKIQEDRLPSQIAYDEARTAKANKDAGIKPGAAQQPAQQPQSAPADNQSGNGGRRVKRGFFNPRTKRVEE